MRTAYVLIRQQPHYRHDAFVAGLTRAGFRTRTAYAGEAIQPGDVVVIWNRYAHFEFTARKFEEAGGIVLVAENGFVGRDAEGRQLYQLARGRHAGFGDFVVGQGDRWAGLGIALEPWHREGDHVLVCSQRGIGTPPVAMPSDFVTRATLLLKHYTRRKLVFRYHPETPQGREQPSLESQLAGAHACVIWTSSAGVTALASGVPVFYIAERWILEGAASRDLTLIDNPPRPDRMPAFQRMAWAQWKVDEIEAGTPFRFLCT
jgi:hypothetical protein